MDINYVFYSQPLNLKHSFQEIRNDKINQKTSIQTLGQLSLNWISGIWLEKTISIKLIHISLVYSLEDISYESCICVEENEQIKYSWLGNSSEIHIFSSHYLRGEVYCHSIQRFSKLSITNCNKFHSKLFCLKKRQNLLKTR